jgi:hypothetical protein
LGHAQNGIGEKERKKTFQAEIEGKESFPPSKYFLEGEGRKELFWPRSTTRKREIFSK